MAERKASRQKRQAAPPSSRAAIALTHVELTWIEKKIERWLRFGRRAEEKILDRRRSISSFKPGSVFAFVRWASNDFGTIVSRMDIVRAVEAGAPYQTLPFVQPGGEILLRVDGWANVERVLQAIDAIEALDIDPADAAPEHWRHLHNRLAVGDEPHAYGIKSFLIAQSLNQIEKAYGPNNSILDNCHVRVSFATNDERTAKRVSDALGTATEMKAMKNYAGSRLSPWLGHLMVSRSETARPLLTPGEVMQLPPTDEIVMVSGVHPIRAKKARYYEDGRFQERIVAPPVPARPKEGRPDDWSFRPLPPRPPAPVAAEGDDADDEDPKNADRRKQPELSQGTVEKQAPIENEFALDQPDDMEEEAPRIGRMNDLMQGLARQASLDPGDDLGM